jgi:hypothetical protein
VAARLLADGLVVAHLAFILFVVAGGLAALYWPRSAWLHLPAVAWAVYAEATATTCPLTLLENLWRRRAGGGGYPDSFVEHYLIPLIYPPGLTPGLQFALAVLVVGINAAVYGWVWRRRRRRSRAAASIARDGQTT